MLTISKPLSTGQAHSYHEQDFANSEQNYYSEARRVAGVWHGKLAAEWALGALVSGEQFYRLAEGQHALTGEQLVRHRVATEYRNRQGKKVQSAKHRAGWDATFSAPKSVSITALVGGDEMVRDAHRQSVNAALDELERFIQARIGGNHAADATGKMVAAKFEHDSARPVNGYSAPQLHTHVVIFNVTQTAEGKPHALQPQELYKSQRFLTAVYRSELATRLKRLGYEIERGSYGEFEIQGYSKEYLEASSPRRRQIQEYLEANKVSGSEAAEIGAHRTREKKAHLQPEEMQRLNLALAAKYANDPREVVSAAEALRRHSQGLSAVDRPFETASEAVSFARDRNIEREARVEERTLLRDALRRAMGEVSLNEVRENLEKRIARGEFVLVADGSGDTLCRSFTTSKMLALERENITMMKSGQGMETPMVDWRAMRQIVDELKGLNDSQRKAARQVLDSRDRITGLQGVAGSGKTTTLSVIREAAERQGYSVEGFSPTSRAAERLAESGIGSQTLQKFLVTRTAGDPAGRRLYVLDESSLASTRQVNDLFKRLTPKDRVLLVGDTRQHQAVDAGRPFQQMQEEGMRTAHLDELVRQRDPGLKQAVECLSQGKTQDALACLTKQHRIHEIPDLEQRLRAVAEEYLKHPRSSLVVSPDNPSRQEINRQIHRSLQIQGKIDGSDHRVRVLVNRHELTGADRQWASRYKPGDVVRYTQGSRRLAVKAGEYATVIGIDKGRNHVTVRSEGGAEIAYDPKRLRGVNVYREEERSFAKGDRVQFTAPFRNAKVANRELGVIEKIDSSGHLRLRLESGKILNFDVREHPHLDYGYAMTSYTSQGQTVDRVIVHVPAKSQQGSDLVNQRFAYVALSRARFDAQVYTGDAETLVNRLGRDVSKAAAEEHRQFRQTGHVAFSERQKQQQSPAQGLALE